MELGSFVVLDTRDWSQMITELRAGIAGRTKSLSLGRYRHVAIVIVLDLILTGVFFTVVQDQEQARTRAEFERQANFYAAAIQKGIEENLEVIESIGGLYAASVKVERDEFREFVRGPLSRHHEIQALSWNERVNHSERRQFEDSVRQEGYPDFRFIGWRPDGQRVVAIERPEYIVVTYVEPYENNQAAMGFDVASDPARLAALERARDTGELITTARITLVQETSNQFGFLILKPIYNTSAVPETVEGRRQNLKGFAVGVFRIGDMVEAALEDLPEGMVNIQLVDDASPAGESLLYLGQASDIDISASANIVNPGEEQLRARGELYSRGPLEIPGRQWSLLITPTPEFLGGQVSWGAWGVLAGGLSIAALLIAYLITVITHGAKTQRLVAELTSVNEGLKTGVIERELAEEDTRESQTRLSGILEIAPDAIVSVDEAQLISLFNQGAERTFGYRAEEIIGKPLDVLLPSRFVEAHQAHVSNFGESPIAPRRMSERGVVFGRRKDGTEFPAEASIFRLELGGEKIFTAILRDITERIRAQEALSKLNAELEQRVREQTYELSKTNNELHAANEELEAFSYSVSHELRAPLRAVDGFSRILLEEYAPQLSGESQRYLRLVLDNAQHMGSLIDDLLTFSRLIRQPLKTEPVAVNRVVSLALADLSSEQEGRRVEISIGELPVCQADPALLREVFVNLLGNSLKYTRGRDVTAIEIGCLAHTSPSGRGEGGEGPVFFVKDNGVGFDMRYVDNLFGAFQRLHPANEYEGTGVGLAIVQRIIHRHGGRIWAKAEVNVGAAFYFTLGGGPADAPNG